jgi:prepilin-type N-terminal cleavage/methylation domain-containing protein
MKKTRTEKRSNCAGFTLIEVMIVVVIIALLTAAAVPLYGEAMRRSRTTALAADMEQVYVALMRYHTDHGSFPAEDVFDTSSLSPLTTEGYFGDATSLTDKLLGKQLLIYAAPDVGGPDQHFIIVARHVIDPSIIVVAVHTDIIAAAEGWVDGVYVITDGDLEEAGDIG